VAPTVSSSVTLAPSGTASFVNRTGTTDNVTVSGGVANIDTTSANSVQSAYDLTGATATAYGAPFPKTLTVLAGLTGTGTSTTSANVMDIDVPLSDSATTTGGRVKLLVRGSGMRIENYNGCSGYHIEFTGNTTGFHIYQLAIEQPNEGSLTVRLFMDGNLMTGTYVNPGNAVASATCDPTNVRPNGATADSFVSNRKATVAGANFVSFGEASSGTAYKGGLDWLIWTRDNAFTPVQLNGKLPTGLGVTTGY
jgi:hypothetical protein